MNCYWKNFCENTYMCCSFCKYKNCQARCKDDFKTCKYLVKNNLEISSESFDDNLKTIRKYVKDNNLNHLKLFKMSCIPYNICKKIIYTEETSFNKNSKEAIIQFIKDNNL